MVVTAEIPAYANRIVNTEWFFVWTRVESSQTLVEGAKRRDAMIGDAQFEMLGQLNGEAHRAFPCQGSHRIGIFHLGNVVAEEKIRLKEKIRVFQRCTREGLKFDVAAHDVTRESGAIWLRLIAAAKIRLIVRRREFEITVAAQEILAEKQATFAVVLRRRNL